jgi:hypothetical protein
MRCTSRSSPAQGVLNAEPATHDLDDPGRVQHWSGQPEAAGVTGPGFEQVSDCQLDLVTPSGSLGRRPTASGIPLPSGIARPMTDVTTRRNPHL